MPLNPDEIQTDVNDIISNGRQVRFKYFTISGANTGYDDEGTYTQSGTDFYTSGLIQPISTNDPRFSQESVLVQQGRLKEGDFRLYINGTVDVSGIWQVGIGSPSTEEYAMVEGGVRSWSLGGEPIYHKVFVRRLTTGSLSDL